MRFGYAAMVIGLVVINAIRKQSLTSNGAFAASIVGLGVGFCPTNTFVAMLLVFFFTSSKLTKWSAKQRPPVEKEDVREATMGRDAVQVFCNGFVGMILAIAYTMRHWHNWTVATSLRTSYTDTALLMGGLGFFACCCGDTWSSLLGVLSRSEPVLITTLQSVPAGTNGGVSLLGLLASMAGGKLIGLGLAFTLWLEGCSSVPVLLLVLLGGMAGLIGSLLDSLLGATLQPSYLTKRGSVSESDRTGKHIAGLSLLNNNQVNFITALVMAGVTAAVATPLFITS